MTLDTNHAIEATSSNSVNITKAPTLRKETGISIEIIAEIAGITVEEYCLYESGKKDLPASTLYLISTLLTGDPFALFEE